MLPHAFLFTDGSSALKDDIGAWGAVALSANGELKKILYGVTHPTTISRCELTPMVEGLRWIKDNWRRTVSTGGYRVIVISDSEYTVRTACGEYQRKKNEELWAALDAAAKTLEVTYLWRERNTNYYTEICDALCGSLRRVVIDAMKTQFENARKIELELPTLDMAQFVP